MSEKPYIEVPIDTDYPVEIQLAIALSKVLDHFERVSPGGKITAMSYLSKLELAKTEGKANDH